MSRSRALLAVALVLALAAGGGGAWLLLRTRDTPGEVAATYLDAWARQDWPAMRRLAAAPPADFTARHQDMLKRLRVTTLRFTPGRARTHGGRAEVPFQARLGLRALADWRYQGELRLLRRDRRWLVDWSPAALHPELTAGEHFERRRSWPPRAPILAADGSRLAGPGPVVVVNVVGGHVTDRAEVAAALQAHAGVPAAAARAALDQAARQPDQLTPVVTLPRARYLAVRDQLHPVPGLSSAEAQGRVTAGPPSARLLLGGLGPVTADDLRRLGPAYQAGDLVGHGNGLEAAFERQLAGRPGGDVRLVGAGGATATVLQRFPATPGEALRTTLDPKEQQAGERALAAGAHGKPAALVALRPSTGELLAVVNTPPYDGFDRALLGRYPPGSTFKVVTAAALLASGLGPDDQVACPKQVKVGGRTFGNFEHEQLGSIPFRTAFAKSCNTAFVGLAARRLTAARLRAAAARFGFGSDPSPGIPAVTGQVPPAADAADLAAEAFGQGRVTTSPLQMATVAATAADGRWRKPRLVAAPGGDAGAAPAPLDPAVAGTLRTLMRLVVTGGTAGGAGLPAGVAGKTGTAEFGSGDPLPTHAWFIGFRGDLAFAVVVEGGGVGGEVAAPIAARFLAPLSR